MIFLAIDSRLLLKESDHNAQFPDGLCFVISLLFQKLLQTHIPFITFYISFQARLRRLSVLKGYKGCSEEESKQLQRSLETTDYISSEESMEEDVENEDSENEAQEKCLIKRPLPWRSELLNLHFEALDKRAKRKQKHKRHGGAQSYKRRVGAASDREEPEDALEYEVADFEEA